MGFDHKQPTPAKVIGSIGGAPGDLWVGQSARPERWSSTLGPALVRVGLGGLAFGVIGAIAWAIWQPEVVVVFGVTASLGMAFMLAALVITRPQNPLLTITTAAAATLLAAFGLAAVFLASPDHVGIHWDPGAGWPHWVAVDMVRQNDVSVIALIAVLIASLVALAMIIFMIIKIAKIAKE